MNADITRVNAYIIDQWGQELSSTVGLTYGYAGGLALSGGVLTRIGAGTVSLPALATSYIERTTAGIVSSNTSGWTAGSIPLAKVVTAASSISSVEDWRSPSMMNLNADYAGRNATWSGTSLVSGLSTSAGFELGSVTIAVSATKAGIANAGTADELAAYAKNNFYIYINGTKCWNVGAAGHLVAGTDASFDIGQSGVLRPRHIYISGQFNGATLGLTQNSNSSVDLVTTTNSNTGGSTASVRTSVADTVQEESGASKALGGAFIGSRSNHPLFLRVFSTNVWQLSTAGHLLAVTDNTYDLGASGATRPRHVYVAQNVTLGGALAVGGSATITGTLGAAATTVTTLASSAGVTVSAGSSKAARAAVTWTGTVSQDLSVANTFEITITGNVGSLTLTNPVTGTWYSFVITQDGTGPHSIAWPGSFRWPFNSPPVLSGANKRDTVAAYWNGTDYTAFISGQNA